MKPRAIGALIVLGFALVQGAAFAAEGPAELYEVEHSVMVPGLPADAKNVRLWFWMPNDDQYQTTESFSIDQAPGDYLIVREPTTGSRFLYAESAVIAGETPGFVTRFRIERREAIHQVNPAAVRSLSATDRRVYAEYLATDTPNMQVNATIRALADEICGNERDLYVQARLIYDYVVDNSDHYSKGGDAPKSSGIGSAEYCLNLGGGGCTDQHSLYIALARARGIPARIQFGSRLQPKNEGLAVDPGYRCWVEYYIPGHGWVCMDASAGDTVDGKRDFYAHGLDNQRIRFSAGRNLDLGGGRRLNLLIGAYVEVDGKPFEGFERRMTFNRVQRSADAAADTGAKPAS